MLKQIGVIIALIAVVFPGVHIVTAGTSILHGASSSSSRHDETSSFFALGRHVWGGESSSSSSSSQGRRRSSTTRTTPNDDLTRIALTAASTATLERTRKQPPIVFKFVQHLRETPARLQRHLPFLRKKVKVSTSTTAVSSSDTAISSKDLTLPIFGETAWMQQSGREFVDDDGSLLAALADAGLEVLEQKPNDGNPWVEWKSHSTVRDNNDDVSSYDTAIDVWTGTSVTTGYGSAAPWIKTRALVPLSPQALTELMMDSARVKTYNAWSTGRDDLWTADTSNDGSVTKIVRNRTQPPMGAKPMVATTLLHARPYNGDGSGSWLLVSRAVGGTNFPLDDPTMGTSEMLLGVNLFEAVPGRPDLTRMTALTHVYSKSIPLMLAERLGVKSAVQFVKDMRALGTGE